MDINHLTLEELKIVKDAITQRINELSGETPQQESLEKSKLALRKYILENKEEVIKDLQEIRDKSSKNKQETLEEAAAKEFPLVNDESCKTGFVEKINLKFIRARQTFIKGAKWQAERMYSEKDLEQAFSAGRTVENYKGEWEETYSDEMTSSKYENFKKWFEQFKKK
jgi:hypothetical protein